MKCRFRIVLEGRETECSISGDKEHDVHRYFAPKSGKRYDIEFVSLEEQ